MAAFDWTSLLTDTAAPLGGKILGEAFAPDPGLINAQSNQQNNAANTQLKQAQFTQQQKAQALALPGMLKTLGYSPTDAAAATKSYGYQPTAPGTTFGGGGAFNGQPSPILGQPSTGTNIAKKALGVGLSVGAPMLGAVGAGGAAAANASIAAGGAPLAAGGGMAGLGSTIGALATNPFTIAGAGALAAGLIWKKSQAHPVADHWVNTEQNSFDKTQANVDEQVKGGAMTPDEAKHIKQQNAQQYLSDLQQFSQQGGKENVVARQAAQTFRQWYGDPAQYGVQINF